MKPSDASVIVPAFGPAHLLEACLSALSACEQPREVLVWDNGVRPTVVPDRPARLLWGHAQDASGKYSGTVDNLGFATACNLAALEATGEVLVFLNVDTEVQAGWLDALVAPFGGDLSLGITGSKLVHPDGTLQHAGIDIHISPQWVQPLEVKDDLPTRDVNAVTGASMAVTRDAWEDLGGFDEGYQNGNDDVDLCLRAWRTGWHIRYVRESVVMHHESATGPERWAHLQENIDRLQRWVA